MTKDEELIERLRAEACVLQETGALPELREAIDLAADRIKALAQPVVGERSALENAREWICMTADKDEIPEEWQIVREIDAALAASPSPEPTSLQNPQTSAPVVGDEGRWERSSFIEFAPAYKTVNPKPAAGNPAFGTFWFAQGWINGVQYEFATQDSRADAEQLCIRLNAVADAILSSTPVMSVSGEAREALEPFATFYPTFANDDGWTSPMTKERIVDWFGPSDFRRAAQAFAALSTPVTEAAQEQEGAA